MGESLWTFFFFWPLIVFYTFFSGRRARRMWVPVGGAHSVRVTLPLHFDESIYYTTSLAGTQPAFAVQAPSHESRTTCHF